MYIINGIEKKRNRNEYRQSKTMYGEGESSRQVSLGSTNKKIMQVGGDDKTKKICESKKRNRIDFRGVGSFIQLNEIEKEHS